MSAALAYGKHQPRCPGRTLSRRDFLKWSAMALASPAAFSGDIAEAAGASDRPAPRAPTSIRFCRRYDYLEVRSVLERMLEEIGGLRRLVRNRHVTVKLNLVNSSEESLWGVPLWLGVTVHPVVGLALGKLLVENGAQQVVFCDQLPCSSPVEPAFAAYGFKLSDFKAAMGERVRFENTRNRGIHGDYAIVKAPGGELATAWEVNRTYVDTDVLVSLTKLKSHVSAGITGGLKNLFGIPPSSLYGDDLEDHPDEKAVGYRNRVMHECSRQPLTSISTFTGKGVTGDHGYNVPHFIVDLAAAFRVDLVVIDGISTIQTAEGWWNGSMVSVTRPGLLIAGHNPVCTDAVAAAVMGFDPDVPDRTWPFANGLNHLALARRRGLGENRLRNLEIAGVGIERARFEYQPTFRRIGT